MSGDVQLEEQGTTVEKRMQDALTELYVELVPPEIRQEISARIKEELAARQEEIEAARKYTAFCVRENGTQSFFQLDKSEDILEVAKLLRRNIREDKGRSPPSGMISCWHCGWSLPAKSPACLIWTLTGRRSPP